MQNAKLGQKLLVLTLLLLALSGVIAWAGISRLQVLDSKVQQLGNGTVKKLLSAGETRALIMASIRAQKNACIATTDEDSKRYAEEAKSTVAAAIKLIDAQFTRSSSEDETKRLNSCRVSIEEFDKINKECLALAVQNSNLKANKELHGRAKDTLERALVAINLIETTLENSKKEEPAEMLAGITACHRLANHLQSMARTAGEHIATSVSDSRFIEVDQRAKELIEQLPKLSESFQEFSQTVKVPIGELNSALGTFGTSLAEVIRLSSLDTNNKAFEMSMSSVKDVADVAIRELDDLVSEYEERAGKDMLESKGIYEESFRYILIACGVGMVLGLGASYWISTSITRPIAMVRDASRTMATGDLRARIALKQKDEVGELADATDALADAISGIVHEIQESSHVLANTSSKLGGIANGLVDQSEETSSRSTSAAAAVEQLSTNISSMSAAAEEMSMNFSSISSATEELSVSVGAISSAADQTASNVGNVAGAVQVISKSFNDVLAEAREGANVAGKAAALADNAEQTMRNLDQSGSEISKFTETIKMIALQTNLLALNATIEATSAGEAGKGFAVVAHEIKELANQSAKAAEDVARKIEGVQNGTRQAVGVISEIADVIKKIHQSAGRISQSVEHQNKSAQTISLNIDEANKGVEHIARSISEVAATANHMARNIAEASRGATDVSSNVSEAAHASSGISQSVVQVSAAAKQTNASANEVTQSAKQLDQVAAELRNLVDKFKIAHDGNA
ncbi:MAG: HAMP domain-containing methyl-accepting chemotaxis protein [Pirellulaceae bacterium]|nr:HAMP domain-containing methyl-accepting chemotaxis protein [Pirellulaceae bacterium]